jgi:polar amino acid transport system ATP-binding protein
MNSPSSPLVKFNRVRKNFGSLEVLRDVTIDLTAGEVMALIGRSGSGKSTALRCVNGLERINGGELTVCGRDLHHGQVNLRDLRQEVGIVFQGLQSLSTFDGGAERDTRATKGEEDQCSRSA